MFNCFSSSEVVIVAGCDLSLVPVVRDDSMSLDSDLDSSDNTVSAVPPEATHVDPDQHPSAFATDPCPPVSKPSLQDQAKPIPVLTTTTSKTPKELDFVALSEAISQFKASKMLSNSDAGETLQTSFRVDPHHSFLNHNDLSDSYPLCLSENHILSVETQVSCASIKIESAVTTTTAEAPLSSSSPVEASCEMVHYGETATSAAAPMTAAENTSNIINISKAWEQSCTSSTDTCSGAVNAQTPNESGISQKPAVNNASSSEPAIKHKSGNSGFLPRPSSSRQTMDCFYPALQGSDFIPAPHSSMGLSGPRLISHNGAIGLRHPLLNCNVSNNLGVMGSPVLSGFLPNPSMQMTWNSLAQGSASGLWGSQYGVDVRQIHQSPFIQTWPGNPAFQGDSYRPNRGGFGGW